MAQQRLRWLYLSQAVSAVVIVVLTVLVISGGSSKNSSYPLLAKRIFLDHPNDVIINFTDLRAQLQTYVTQAPEKVGVYFEYLPTGTSININGNTEFYRASLVKLPVVMRAYKYIESGDLSLDTVLTVEEKQLNRDFGSLWKRGAGTQLTVRELIKLILDNSDNTAFNVLYEKVNVQLRKDAPSGDQSADDVYDYLDIPREATGITAMITPKNYASILKSLFFSAYLPYKDSNEILSTLTQPHPENWLRSGVQSDILVADKIGAYTAEPAENHVFSDCGIIYYPQRPYILCVMVNTDDQAKAVPHIKTVSQDIFDYIKKQ